MLDIRLQPLSQRLVRTVKKGLICTSTGFFLWTDPIGGGRVLRKSYHNPISNLMRHLLVGADRKQTISKFDTSISKNEEAYKKFTTDGVVTLPG
jgi:hypothetical protein